MPEVRPLAAIRYAPHIDLARVICPPFDVITAKEQRRLYQLSPENAVRLELPKANGDPYQAAAKTLRQWLDKGTLVRDTAPAFYVYQQEFRHSGERYRRRVLFGRLRLAPWDEGSVRPHELTFSGPKEDRLRLLRSLRLNTSPVLLVYPDSQRQVEPLLARAFSLPPGVEFRDGDGLAHSLWRIEDAHAIAAIGRGLERDRLYVADGHHRYETALAYRRERAAQAAGPRSGEELEDFVLVAIAMADDPGLLVRPIHRLVDADVPLERVLDRLSPLLEVETQPSLSELLSQMADRGRMVNCLGLAAAESPDLYLLTLFDLDAAERYLPSDRSPAWSRLDVSIANYVILRRAMGLDDARMEDIRTVRYGEDAETAVAEVRKKRARYAVLLNPISPRRVLAVADAGERMPQKSTFFYPKLPTGLLYNPLWPNAERS